MHPRESFPNSPKTRGWPKRPAVPGISPAARPERRGRSEKPTLPAGHSCTRAWHTRAGSSSQGAPLWGRGRSVSGSPPDTSRAAGEILSPSAPLPARSPPPSPAAGYAITAGAPGDGKRVLKPDRPCCREHGSGSRLLQTPAWAGGSGAGGTGRFAERSPAAPAAFPRHPGRTSSFSQPLTLVARAEGFGRPRSAAACRLPKAPQAPTPELLADIQAGAPGEALHCPVLQPRQAGRQSLQLVGTPLPPVQKHPGLAAGGPPAAVPAPTGPPVGLTEGDQLWL